MVSESQLKKDRVELIEESTSTLKFKCLRCTRVWIRNKRSNGKKPCEYWYCPEGCTDWDYTSSGKELKLKDSSAFVVPIEIKSSKICKKYMIEKIRKEMGDVSNKGIVEKVKKLNREFLFSWTDSTSDITNDDKTRIKELLNKDMDVNWVENAEIKINKKSISFSDDKKNALSFTCERDSKVSLKIKNKDGKPKKFLNLIMEKDTRNIYKLAKFDLALHLQIDTFRLNNQDVDNIQKTVLDALKKRDSSENYLYEDDAQIFRVFCWKTKKEDIDKYNTAALAISIRVYDPDKPMLMENF